MEINIPHDNKPVLHDENINYNYFDKEEKEFNLSNNQIDSLSSISGSNYFQENNSQNDNMINKNLEKKVIYFVINGEKIKQDNKFILMNCPAIVNLIKTYKGKNNEIYIELPKNITKEHIDLFYEYIKNPILFIAQISNNQMYLLKLFKMSLYFENKAIIFKIINEEIVKVINEKNITMFYKFVKENINIEKKIENIEYYKMIMNFIKPVIVNNFHILIYEKDFNHIIDENDILEFMNKYCFMKKLQVNDDIIEYICQFYGFTLKKLFFLISYLYNENLKSEKIFYKLNNVKLNEIELNPEKNYQEFEINVDDNQIFFETLLDKKDMKCLIGYKTKDLSIYISSVLYINENNPIINFSKFSSYQVKVKENTKKVIKIKLKLDYLFTSLFNYFILKTNNYIDSYSGIGKLNFNLVQDIFQAFKSNHINSNVSLICFMKIIDKINLEENDINILLKNINFREVSLEVLSEFYIKFLCTEKLNSDIIIFVNKILKENNIGKLINYLAKNINTQETSKKSFKKLSISKYNFSIISNNLIKTFDDNQYNHSTINKHYPSKSRDSFSDIKSISYMNSLIQESMYLRTKDNQSNSIIYSKSPNTNKQINRRINSFNKQNLKSQKNINENFLTEFKRQYLTTEKKTKIKK